MDTLEAQLNRWQQSGLIGSSTAESIRSYEAGQTKPRGHQWQVLLALILGGILLGSGILLFVAAHWDQVSPTARMALVLGMLVFFHGLGLAFRDKFGGFAIAMHALGTVSAGAAIALTGQIFNMQEHWPSAVMVWALCAAAGWWLLCDQFQETLTLVLLPAWICSEFVYRLEYYGHSWVWLARILAVLAAAYLSAWIRSTRRVTCGILFAVGAVLLPLCVGALAVGWSSPAWSSKSSLPIGWQVAGWLVVLAIGAAAWWMERTSIVPVGIAAVLGVALPWTTTTLHAGEFNYTYSGPGLLSHVLVASAAIGLVAWGVRTQVKALVNYGMAAFAATVAWFYFSDVMDKLDRSLGLIALGVLFLGGGWTLELTRRRLLGAMEGEPA